jgi:hypothetical protein
VNRKTDGKIQHPADGRQWKQFDLAHQEDFSNEPRNTRFGLSTDGMKTFREMRNPHSTWTVIMYIFNLPPWLCHKRKYLLLTTLVSGPKQAGNDIDIFRTIGGRHAETLGIWDKYNKQHFNLNAIIF